MDKVEEELKGINVEEPVKFEQPIEPQKMDVPKEKTKEAHKLLVGFLFILTMLASMALGAFMVWYFIFDGKF